MNLIGKPFSLFINIESILKFYTNYNLSILIIKRKWQLKMAFLLLLFFKQVGTSKRSEGERRLWK